jgi:hypothetical protein
MSTRSEVFSALFVLLITAACSDLPTAPDPLAQGADPGALLASHQPPVPGCVNGVLPGGALSRICFPPDWNGDAILWAHGYVAPFVPIALPDDRVGGQRVEDIVLGLGYAYGTTSYRRNGLVAVDAMTDLVELSQALDAAAGGHVRFTYLVGASEGGLATALAMERAAAHFDGGLVACAPVGSFRGQINYFADVRVLFDYFFPGVLPGSPLQIPAALIANWVAVYQPAVIAALIANPAATAQLIRTAGIAVDPADPTTAVQSVVAALWYNVFATNDARARLGGGIPYDNRLRWYAGSTNDLQLNLRVARFRADASALAAMMPYEATGALRGPAQMIHTRFDPIVPFWQAQIYQTEALFRSGLQLLSVPSDNYGHCAFTAEEVLASFAVLVLRVSLRNLVASASIFADADAVRRFELLAAAGGATPEVRSGALR